jgi:nicotinamidase-related amidase
VTTYDRIAALVVIDVQNDFADPTGSLHVPNGDEIIRLVNAEIAAARERLIVCGLLSDHCVLETVLDAVRLGYHVGVHADTIRAVDLRRDDGERAVERMRASGATIA